MASMKVPYLVILLGGKAKPPRYFWQPSATLRAAGWRQQRVPADWRGLHDPAALEAAAMAKARALNAEVNAWRSGAPPAAIPGQPEPKKSAREKIPGSIAHVIALYRLSDGWKRKAAKTQRAYNQNLDVIEQWNGDAPVRAITPKMVQELYAALQPKVPAKANAVIGMARILLGFARREGLVTVNAAAQPALIGTKPSGMIWPLAAVPLFVKHADALKAWSIGTAILFNHWLGQREADVLKMRRPRASDGALIIRQNKTGAGVKLAVGVVPQLVARLDAETERQAKDVVTSIEAAKQPFLLNELTGLPYTEDDFRHRFAEIRAAAAKEIATFVADHVVAGSAEDLDQVIRTADLKFMHLRHTAVVRLAEAEVDIPGISAITGHTLKSVTMILERYLVRTGAMAEGAFRKRIEHEAKP